MAKKYVSGRFEYRIDSIEAGKIVLLGNGQDGEKAQPVRETIVFTENSLEFLKETRTPWQFRNQTILRRTEENVLSPKIFSSAKLKEDFDVFKKTLKTIHPGIYRYQTPKTLEKLFDELEANLKNPLSEAEFFKLVAQFTSQIHCGHTYPNPYNQNPLVRERIFNGKSYLPFYFQIVAGKMIITENASLQSLSRGSEIVKVNGVAAKKIIETLLTITSADGKNTLAHRIDQLELKRFEAERYALFDWYFPLFFAVKNGSFVIEAVDAPTGKTIKFETPAMTKDERTAEMKKRYSAPPTYDDGWKFEIRNGKTAYLTIGNSITWRLKTIKFKEFLANAFAEMREKKVEFLIIDLRGNGGGDTDIGFELARYLARNDLPVYLASRRLVRNVAAQPDLLKYLDTYSMELKTNLQNGLPPDSFKKAENNYFEILPTEKLENYPAVTPDKNNFQGTAFLISDASNASATAQFLNYAKENKLAKIVGQQTGGNRQGINGGNYYFLRLPNSKIEIDVPVFYFAPFKTRPDESVIPDVVVKSKSDDISKGIDAEISAIENLIDGKK